MKLKVDKYNIISNIIFPFLVSFVKLFLNFI